MPPIRSPGSTVWGRFRCWKLGSALPLLHEPPDAERHVLWCGRTAGVIPPPTRSRKSFQYSDHGNLYFPGLSGAVRHGGRPGAPILLRSTFPNHAVTVPEASEGLYQPLDSLSTPSPAVALAQPVCKQKTGNPAKVGLHGQLMRRGFSPTDRDNACLSSVLTTLEFTGLSRQGRFVTERLAGGVTCRPPHRPSRQ